MHTLENSSDAFIHVLCTIWQGQKIYGASAQDRMEFPTPMFTEVQKKVRISISIFDKEIRFHFAVMLTCFYRFKNCTRFGSDFQAFSKRFISKLTVG